MHSLVLLTLLSSAFAAPLYKGGDVVNAPIDIKAPINGVVGAAVKAVAPVNAAVGNVAVKGVNVGNGILSGNDVYVRHVVNAPVDVKAPAKAVAGASAYAKAPVNAAVGNAGIKDVNALNGITSGNHVHVRQQEVDVVYAPADVLPPVYGVAGAAAKVVAPVDAAAENIEADTIDSVNNIDVREVDTRNVVNAPSVIKAPVDAIVSACADVTAPVNAAVGNVNVKDARIANGILSGNDVKA